MKAIRFLMSTRFFYPVLAIAVVCTVAFFHFPLMGHDYLYFFTWASDYHFAWNKFGVFHYHFTPQRCFGVPVWANPVGANFSIFHIFSLFLEEAYVAVAMFVVYLGAGFWGTRKFLSLFEMDEEWKNYLSLGWVLQGYIVSRALVGHVGYVSLALWPLYAYLLLRPETRTGKRLLFACLYGCLIAHDFYLAQVYYFAMVPVAICLLIFQVAYLGGKFNYKDAFLRLFLGTVFASVLILPKVIAVMSFTRNFPRKTSFVQIGFPEAMEYAFFSKWFPIPLDYRKVTGWWYGNWESFNYIFPGLALLMFVYLCVRFKQHKKIAVSQLVLLLISAFISSGVYAPLAELIPVVSSFHVNPRWVIMVQLAFLANTAFFLRETPIARKWIVVFLLVNVSLSYLIIDMKNMGLSHVYRSGYDPKNNISATCYEPAFGYRLELLPVEEAKKGVPLDPRCYLKPEKCQSLQLPPDKIDDLMEYRLQPFED